MKLVSSALIVILSAAALAADAPLPDFKNGDFENGKQFWKGDGKIVIEKEGNKVLELKAGERAGESISQEFDLGKLSKIGISMRIKGVGFKGSGLRVVLKKRNGDSTFSTKEVVEGEWKEIKMVWNRLGAESKYTVLFTPEFGKGSIQIDDVKTGPAGE